MEQEEIKRLFSGVNAIILDSHIVYTSGKHGSAYVNKDAIYPYIELVSKLCEEIADRFPYDSIQAVIAPAIGGVILSQWVAGHLMDGGRPLVLAVYAEKSEDGHSFVIKRGYDKLIAGKNVLVVEDVLTTGGSARKVIEATRAVGGNVIGLGALCNRGNVTLADLGNPPKFISLLDIKLESFDEADCPLCRQGIPINTDVGKGREFLVRKQLESSR